MKKLLIILVFIYSQTNAQVYRDVVKFLPTSLVLNAAGFEWEQQQDRNSIVLTVLFPVDRKIPNGWMDASSTMHLYGIRGAYRHYLEKNNVFGFYIEPYVKWNTFDWKSTLQQGMLKGYFYTTNIGLQLGYQFLMGKHFVVDCYFGGLELGRANGRTESWSPNENDAQYMEKYVGKLSKKLPDNTRTSINRNGKIVESETPSFLYPWFRVGVGIGYKF